MSFISAIPCVWNIRNKRTPANAVYVGRTKNGGTGKWGNPFKVQFYGRSRAIQKYEAYIQDLIENGERDITELAGKDLVCHCAPKACHADVLVRLANPELFVIK